jgi:LmbE family N-acetylglucosaminyl deacetylase
VRRAINQVFDQIMKIRTRLGSAARPRRTTAGLALAACLVFGSLNVISNDASRAQVRPIYDQGALALGLALRRLQTTASVLHVGAHPDDEDSALIAELARHDGARVAYLSLNRGEGGQNRIGPELFDALGVIRTEELLQARRLDGGQQFFTRAFDFGFTKTLEETRRRWDERAILGDMVRVIRTFRPLVVVSRWQGTPADGHGQHQFSGYLAPKAFRAAADPAQFPEQIAEGLRPWQPLKFYVSANLNPTRDNGAAATTNNANTNNANTTQSNAPATQQSNVNSNATNLTDANTNRASIVRIETGDYDPLLGRSAYELAMEGRSQHKSQGETALELKGEQASGARLVERAPGPLRYAANEQTIFDGIDTSVRGIARTVGIVDDTVNGDLRKIQSDAATALEKFNASDPRTVLAALVAGLSHAREARGDLSRLKDDAARAEADFLLAEKEREFADALRLATGARADALADAEAVARGDSFNVVVRAYAPEELKGRVKAVRLRAPEGWKAEELSAQQIAGVPPSSGASQSGASQAFGRERATREAYFRVSVPPDAQLTQPYWLKRERKGDLYEWDKGDPQTLPFAPAPLIAEVVIDAGEPFTIEQPVEYRYLDNVRGEVRRELNVVPELTVRIDPALEIVPRGSTRLPQPPALRLTDNMKEGGASAARFDGVSSVTVTPFRDWPPGKWVIESESAGGRAARAALQFAPGPLPPPTKDGAYPLLVSAQMRDKGAAVRNDYAPERSFNLQQRTVSYPHIQTHRIYTPAATTLLVLDLKVAPVSVGYVMGSGDEVPAAIERMGLKVTMLGEDDLSTGDLSRFDTIVVGVRASQARPDFVANNKRLIDFVNQGGTLIVQYQRPDYAQRGLPPFPATMETRNAQGQTDISRVVDETGPVRVLAPDSPVFNFPNRITDEDFRGWVQERNLYNFVTFDARYTPLLESHDAGEPENKGGMVFARMGRGAYVYTSYAFFRQLPAGVPGAYRIFANLLSLPKASNTRAAR